MSSAVRQWLETLGLAQYGDRFEAKDIDLEVLPSLSEQDLGELGVSMGHRKKGAGLRLHGNTRRRMIGYPPK